MLFVKQTSSLIKNGKLAIKSFFSKDQVQPKNQSLIPALLDQKVSAILNDSIHSDTPSMKDLINRINSDDSMISEDDSSKDHLVCQNIKYFSESYNMVVRK